MNNIVSGRIKGWLYLNNASIRCDREKIRRTKRGRMKIERVMRHEDRESRDDNIHVELRYMGSGG